MSDSNGGPPNMDAWNLRQLEPISDWLDELFAGGHTMMPSTFLQVCISSRLRNEASRLPPVRREVLFAIAFAIDHADWIVAWYARRSRSS